MWSCRVGRVATPTLRGFKCSRRRALSSCDKMREAVEGIQKIKNAMNEQVCGHHEIKHGILLSFISNQHCYIEGPPGSAKTMLAEIAATCFIFSEEFPTFCACFSKSIMIA